MDIGKIIQKAGHNIAYLDTAGNRHEVWEGHDDETVRVTARVSESRGGIRVITLSICNCGKESIRLQEAAVLDVFARRGGLLALGGGGSAWTMLTSPLSTGVVDLCDLCGEARKLDYSSTDYSLIGNRKSDRYVLLGFLAGTRMFNSIRLKLNENGYAFERLQAICDFSGAPLAPGETQETEPLYVNTDAGPKAALDDYIGRLAATSGLSVNFQDIIGWATWDYYQANITEQDIMENVAWLSARKNTLPVRYIQLDHGFQRCEGDWLKTNKKFPSGLKWLADNIRARGFVPGLWLCPFLVAPESEVYREHPDWVIRNAAGSPLEMHGYAVPIVYGLDCSIPEAREWIRNLGRQVTVDFGFKYVKLDGAIGQILSELGRLRDPAITLGSAAHMGLAAFRDGMSKDAFLLNGFRPCFSIGLCDAMRIGDDVGGRWDGTRIAKHHGERDRFNGPGEVLRSIAAMANHFYFHKKTWVNDSDYLVVRQEGCNSELTYEEARSWASFVGLSNGLVMLSDNMPLLLAERVELIEKVLPHYRRPAVPVDFFRKNVPSFYALDAGNQDDNWKVLCVLNPDYPARVRDYVLPLEELGLARDKDYCLFDFWNRRYLGTIREALRVEALAPHDCRVFRITEASHMPQVIGSDIHISMGGVEIEATAASAKGLKIKLSNLGREGNLYLRGAAGWAPHGTWPAKGGVLRLPVKLDGREISVE